MKNPSQAFTITDNQITRILNNQHEARVMYLIRQILIKRIPYWECEERDPLWAFWMKSSIQSQRENLTRGTQVRQGTVKSEL